MNVKDIIVELIKQGLDRTKNCLTCPYRLGILKTFVNPCPSCMGRGMFNFNSKKILNEIIKFNNRF